MKIKKLNHLKYIFLEISLAIKTHWEITIDAIIIGWEEKKYIINENEMSVIIILLIII